MANEVSRCVFLKTSSLAVGGVVAARVIVFAEQSVRSGVKWVPDSLQEE